VSAIRPPAGAAPRAWRRSRFWPAPPAARHAKGGAQGAKGAPVKGKAAHEATPAKNAPPAKKTAAAAPVISAACPGSKKAQVVAMLSVAILIHSSPSKALLFSARPRR
jgi:hypothetical protein